MNKNNYTEFGKALELCKGYLEEYVEKDLEEVVKEYQETGEEIHLAYLFYKMVWLIQKKADIYYSLGDDDKVSIAFEMLIESALTFVPGYLKSGSLKSAKFSSYFISLYVNRLRREIQSRKYDKRKANNNCKYYFEGLGYSEDGKIDDEVDNDVDDGLDNLLPDYKIYWDDLSLVDLYESIKNNEMFLSGEVDYCLLVMEYEDITDAEIAEVLNYTRAGVYGIKKRLKKKLEIFLNAS